MDDTNPSNETDNFETEIIRDIDKLGVKYTKFTRTSDYFDLIQQFCHDLIINNYAYVDSTEVELMRTERDNGICSSYRTRSPEENLNLFKQMINGDLEKGMCCVRLKIDYQHKNKALRDPTI